MLMVLKWIMYAVVLAAVVGGTLPAMAGVVMTFLLVMAGWRMVDWLMRRFPGDARRDDDELTYDGEGPAARKQRRVTKRQGNVIPMRKHQTH